MRVTGRRQAGVATIHRRTQRLFLVSILWALLPSGVLAQISPGALARAHASLDGPLHCASCHKLGKGATDLKCLDCHAEIAQRLAARRGFHASVLKPGATGRDCVPCHSDHNGRDFSLVRWDPSLKGFDHRKTGYPLEGGHASLTCEQCHNAKNIAPQERTGIKILDLNRTFLGLSRDCVSCHADVHRGQLGKDCVKCHNVTDWKAASTGFDHSKTRYPLTGAHAQVACQKCHTPETSDPKSIRFVGLAFGKCADCHSDPHHGEFKASCESCHTTAGWKQLSETRAGANFDHSTTKFPLLGKHAGVRCVDCHISGAFDRPLPHARCLDCHKDAHQGQFLARKDGGDCASCHTEDGFRPARFGLKEHAATAYPLQAKHADVPCAKCHIPAGEKTIYKLRFTKCTDCHKDVHQGQFSSPPNDNRCEACHTVRGFKPSTFTLARHNNATRFPLTGGHLATPCGDCHQLKEPGSGKPVPYHFAILSCTECHIDPHKGEFADRMKQTGRGGTPAGCEACHGTKAWEVTERFDHSSTQFRLTGSHRAVKCIECHKPPNLELTMKNVAFNAAPLSCEGCHLDPHAGQFARDGKTPGCVDCHNTNKWRPSLFDHDTGAAFPLKGAHQDVPCADCHKTSRMVADKPVLFYKPTPTRCVDCHGPGNSKSSTSG
jgi:hypothetical protein